MKKQNFANNLKNLREKNNLTQSKLSKILDISRQAIYSYEQGKATPSIDILEKLTEIFNCSLDSLIFTETTLNTSKFTDINNLLDDDYSKFSPLEILTCTKENLLKKRILIDETITDIDNAISKIKKDNTLAEYSEELSFSSNLNFLSLDFYKKNNVRIFNTSTRNNVYKIPQVGCISAGDPILAEQNIEEYFSLDKESLNIPYDKYFILRVIGESMNEIFRDNDSILCKICNEFIPNTPLVVLVDNESATVKYIEKNITNNTFSLIPKSTFSDYHIKTYSLDKHTLSILGVVVGVIK